jgi:chromosome partitioning protein
MSKIIAIINQKGGVGKTTTSINLAYELSLLNKSVLLIDLDPQGHSTVGIGIQPGSFEYAVQDVLLNSTELNKVIINKFRNLDVVPANFKLDNCEFVLTPAISREKRLNIAIRNSHYDYIILDCRPSVGTLSHNAIFACNFMIVPCEVSKYSLEGFTDLLNTVKAIKDDQYDEFKNNIKILMTKYDSRKSISNEWFIEELSPYSDMVLNTRIRQNEALNQAHIAMQPVTNFDKTSLGAADYLSLTKEILSYE